MRSKADDRRPGSLRRSRFTPGPIRRIGSGAPTKVERYFLGWHRHLYDTFCLYHGLADESAGVEVVELPSGGRPPAAEAAGPPPEGASTLLHGSPTPR